jgi:predicted ArsR family transcriptional regulator
VSVKNIDPALGPLPAAATDGPPAPSRQRTLVLDVLHRHGGPATVGELAAEVGLHENTVREHLEGLLAARLVRRDRAPAVGRGRPAWRYVARSAAQSTMMRDYVALASVLADLIHRTSADPESAATTAGETWGRALVADLPPEPGARAARERVIELFDDLGFAPDPDGEARTVRLTRCPMLEVARERPDVVCSVHGGLAAAALASLGAPDDARTVTLGPFAEPGACLLQLGRDAAS